MTAELKSMRAFKSVSLFFNSDKPEAVRNLKKIATVLRSHRVDINTEGDADFFNHLTRSDIAIAVGGDGTMLKAARNVAPFGVPLLGINSGGLGFLAGLEAPDFSRYALEILSGHFRQEERLMIETEIWREKQKIFGPVLALNDCVIRCGDQARAVLLEMKSEGHKIADYLGDGLIVSTPTGSSAYALAASGPLIEPSLQVLLSLPICSHMMTQRPLIFPASERVSVILRKRRSNDIPQVFLSIDGQISRPIDVEDEVHLRRFKKTLKVLLSPESSYYETLRKKIHWGER